MGVIVIFLFWCSWTGDVVKRAQAGACLGEKIGTGAGSISVHCLRHGTPLVEALMSQDDILPDEATGEVATPGSTAGENRLHGPRDGSHKLLDRAARHARPGRTPAPSHSRRLLARPSTFGSSPLIAAKHIPSSCCSRSTSAAVRG